MLVDPISVTAASPTPALTFSVIAYTGTGSTRKDVANGYTLDISHTQNPKSGERHYMKISQSLSAVNPLTGGTSVQTASVSISASIPSFGWTAATKAALVKALLDTLSDTEVTVDKFIGFQS